LIGWPQLRISGHADATHSSPPRGEWSALTSVTHRNDAVNSKSSKATCDLYVGQWFWTTYGLDF